MTRQKSKAEHEVERLAILRLLVEVGFHPVTGETVLAILSDSFHYLSATSLDFHLGYMESKGWITRGDGWARITAAGVEELDARKSARL